MNDEVEIGGYMDVEKIIFATYRGDVPEGPALQIGNEMVKAQAAVSELFIVIADQQIMCRGNVADYMWKKFNDLKMEQASGNDPYGYALKSGLDDRDGAG